LALEVRRLTRQRFTYEYYNATITHNGEPPVSYEGQYSPDLMSQYALGYLDDAVSRSEPFFIAVAPIAPHSNMRLQAPRQFDLPEYAKRHAGLFSDYKIPRTENFNPDVPSGVSWVHALPKLNQTLIDYHDEFQRSRLRALQSVDEMIDGLVNSLRDKDLLDNTYIIYTTDNGFHISQHRLPPGKECPFEEDIHIPLMIRGPGVPTGETANVVSSHTDLTPTILKLAGGERPDLDGYPIPLNAEALSAPKSGEHVNVEFWGEATLEGKYGSPLDDPETTSNNTYKALRLIGEDYNILYTVWCSGEREFYDVTRDPSQMHNYHDPHHTPSQIHYDLLGRSFKHVMNRLDALLMVTKSCKGWECHEPWRVLHPDGSVATLGDALHKSFDAFYEGQPRVSFSSCVKGHVIGEEGPQDVTPWERSVHESYESGRVGDDAQGPLLPGTARKPSFERNGRWSDWT
jgi:N-acetylglucosamine-6-sulfatase